MNAYLLKAKNFISKIASFTYQTYCRYTPSSAVCLFQWIVAKLQIRSLAKITSEEEESDSP